MKRLRFPDLPLLLVIATGCHEAPMTPDPEDLEPQFAQGGVPGPPSGVIIPSPPGPPPTIPVPLPPQAGPPSILQDIVEVGAGDDFGCALRSDGVAFCWGLNSLGQLGDGSQDPSSVPVEVSGPTRFARLFVGNLNACGLTATGEAHCWGNNSNGQVGAGSSSLSHNVPAAVSGGHSFSDLSIGLASTCGVATDGFTYCWGSNSQGQLGIGTQGGSSNVPVQVVNSGALGLVQVSAGFFVSCALDAAGGAFCWGWGSLFGNGTTAPWSYVPTPAAGGATLSTIEAGSIYACALDLGGAASCWGDGMSGELGIGATGSALSPTPVVGGLSFASLDTHNNNSVLASTCGITTLNETWCWGSNQYGQLGASSSETCTRGAIIYDCSTSPVAVGGGHAFQQIAVGIRHVCAVDTDGGAWCWGANNRGQLGDGTMLDSSAPVNVRGL